MKSGHIFLNCSDSMKRFLISGLCGLMWVQLAVGQVFNNTGTYQMPPNFQNIDAATFINSGVFSVTVPVDNFTLQAANYSTIDTLNYTNTGTMIGSPGFDLKYYPNNPPPPKPGVPFNNMAATFINQANGFSGGIINCIPSVDGFQGNTGFIISATNIVNSGTVTLDNSGLILFIFSANGISGGNNVGPALISMTGQNVDLSDGTLAFVSSGNFSNSTFGVSSVDSGVGTDTNGEWDPGIELTQNSAISSLFATRLLPAPFFQNLFLQNSTAYSENQNGVAVGTNLVIWRSIFLQDTSPNNVIKNVYFDASGVGNGALHIEWAGSYIDPLTGSPATNYLYLSDVPADLTAITVTNALFVQNGVPLNYTFAESSTPLLNPANAASPGLAPILPGLVTNLYSYLSLQLIPTLTSTNTIFGGSITNLPDRIEISASRSLNLTGAQLTGPDYLSLRATNQFDGNVGVSLDAPFSDLNLGVTNGFLSISNLVRPLLPRWSGTIQAFTARWFVTDAFGVTNDYRVLLVNSDVFPTTVPQIQNLTLHATNNLVISDSLNISKTLSIDATSLTLTTNGAGSLSTSGGLNFLSPDIIWSGSMPRLLYLTNSGVITAQNLINFAGNMSSPYSNPNLATPYQVFINHGVVTNEGTFIAAKYFVNDGVFQNGLSGNFNLIAGCAVLTNGVINTPAGAGNISIAANNLTISNHNLAGGGSLTLAVSDCFSDGFSLFNQFGHVVTTNTLVGTVSNGDFWTLSGNLSAPVKPATGDMLGTTISNNVPPAATAVITWAGKDLGCVPAGFVNNLAVGRLALDGNARSKFRFTGAGPGSAIYVDRLELYGTATNLGPAGLTNITIDPNMRVYYAQAIANDTSIAEKLQTSLANNGRFCWVSNYAGVFSSTNIFYSNGTTYTFNEPLVESCNIDSRTGTAGDNHLPNCSVQDPIPTNWVFDLVVSNAPCVCDSSSLSGTGSGLSLGGSLPVSYPGGNDPTVLPFPEQLNPAVTAVSNLFVLSQGTYNGLFYDATNGVSLDSAGYFKGTLTPKGKLTGSIKLAGKTYSFAGAFDLNGHLVKTNLHPDKHSLPLNLDAQLDLSGNRRISGSVTSSNWFASLLADQLATNAIKGKFTFVIPGDDIGSTNSPSGHGSGTIRINSNGTLQWSGILGDGYSIPATRLSGVSSQGVWPLYYTPYSGAGLVLGWIQLDTNQPDSDLSGETIWIKPGGLTGKNAKFYPAGFTNQIEVVGSSYVQTTAPAGNAMMVLAGGNLSQAETNNFAWKSNFKAQGTNQFTLSLTKTNGVFTGGETVPANLKAKFQGVILQKLDAGYGFFLGTNQSGQVWYVPLP